MATDYHKLYPDEFEQAHMEAAGALVGHTLAKGQPVAWTQVLADGFKRACAAAFDRGVQAALVEVSRADHPYT